jgi:hypothetical protein
LAVVGGPLTRTNGYFEVIHLHSLNMTASEEFEMGSNHSQTDEMRFIQAQVV